MPLNKKMTYAHAVLAAVTEAGMLSRAGLAMRCKQLGCDNASKMKTAIAKALKDGVLAMDSVSYILGDAARGSAGTEYERRLLDARDTRDQTHREKNASRARAEKTYSKNLKAAGGLTATAKADRAWMEGVRGVGRPDGRLVPM
jgi:hypothetical protein